MNVDRILDLLEQNEIDYFNLPHYGLVPDWRLRYWQLHELLLQEIDDQGPDGSEREAQGSDGSDEPS
tara:strand:- start:245 stop:445 length:201 start_codon:yes stop_codon:yes gene_type:complete